MYIFINSNDRTSDVVRDSVIINDNIQEMPNKLSLKMKGNRPSEYQEIKAYSGYSILSSTSNSVTLNASFKKNDFNLFREGDIVYVAINLSDEEPATIQSISNNGGDIQLTMTSNFTNTPVAGELVGKLEFAGNIVDIDDRNIAVTSNIEYKVTCLDQTRLFDKQLINETYEDEDARYIVNDFCNSTINYNQEIDEMNYADNSAIQAEWIESGDGDNPTVDTSDYREGTSSGVLPWTNSSGTANFVASPSSNDYSDFTGVTSGTPTKGVLGFWYACSDHTVITDFRVRIGSDASNYAEITITPSSNNWVFEDQELSNASITGTPDWTALDYLEVIVNQTGDGNLKVDGFRMLEIQFFRHYPYVSTSATINDYRIPQTKPTEVMKRLADELGWYWYIDYNRYIHLFPGSTTTAPFTVEENTDNFNNLAIDYDTSRLVNRQIVEGGDETSETTYSEVKEGNDIQREWILKARFKNLEVLVDNNSSTDTMEGGTTTTNVNATAHGLVTGDYIVNRTRSNAVRQITKVDDDNFTVEAVTSQTNGDTFSKFISQNVGVEGLDVDTGNDYMSNFNEKSVRSAENEATLTNGEFILFRYNQVNAILVKRHDWVSVGNLKSILGYTNGIIDGQKIVDKSIKSRTEATALADSVLNQYSNTIINASFSTNYNGLESGQQILIKDTANGTRNINKYFIIQKIIKRQVEWGHYVYEVKCSSLLFGMLELLQQLLKQDRKIEIDENARIDNVEDMSENVTINDAISSAVDDNLQSETVNIADVISEETVFTPPFVYEPDGASVSRYNLASYS